MSVLFIHDEKHDNVERAIEVRDHLRVEIRIGTVVSAVREHTHCSVTLG